MKLSSRIPLNETIQVEDQENPGTTKGLPRSRTIAEEIVRLRYMGAIEQANRLESSCDDTHLDTGEYVANDPVTGKSFAGFDDAPAKKGK